MNSKTKKIEIDSRDASVILYSLQIQLKRVKSELMAMRDICENKKDGYMNRECLPNSLKSASIPELEEQIDPWMCLFDHYESLIDEFDPNNWK